MKRMIRVIKDYFVERKKAVFDLFIIIFGLGSLMLNSSFSFNPIFLSSLFLIYYSGLIEVIAYCSIGVVLAMFSSFSFGFEIALISVTYLVTNYLIHKIKPDNKIKYFALMIVNLFLILMSVRNNFNFETIVNILVFVAIQYFVIDALEHIKNTFLFNQKSNLINRTVFLVCLSSLLLFIPYIGSIFYFIVGFFVVYYGSKEENSLFFLLSYGVYGFILHYSLETTMYILLPMTITIFFPKKFKIWSYLVPHIVLSFVYQIYIFYNLHFYVGLISICLYFIIPKHIFDTFYNLLSNKEKVVSDNNYLLEEYLSNVQEALNGEEYDDGPSLERMIKREHCQKCEHQIHCRIKENISQYLKNKLTKSNKTEINAYCLIPNRMTLSLQDGYNTYHQSLKMKENSYRERCQMNATIETLKRPLLRKSFYSYSLEQLFSDYGIKVYNIMESADELVISLGQKDYERFHKTIEEIIIKYNTQLELKSMRYDALTSVFYLKFSLKSKKNMEIGEFTKAKISGHNGDNYCLFKVEDKQEIVLCDGMGSGEQAERNAKYLMNTFVSSLKVHRDYKMAINEVNRLLKMKNQIDNFSTLDYAEIDSRTLVLTSIKAGAYSSFLYRDKKIKIIPNNSLPLGIIDEVNINPIRYQLQRGDILIMMSDGLGESFEKCKNSINYEGQSALTLTRTIYEAISKKYQVEDDATTIIIKIL